MKFTKMQGCGNDYVYVNCFEETVEDPKSVAIKVSDRHFGIGSDGLILIKPSKVADFCMDMYNADGSQSEMCGNGIRCVAKYVYDYGLTDKTSISVETLAGIKYLDLKIENGKAVMITVNMGAPELIADKVPVKSDKEKVIDEPIVVAGKEYKMTDITIPDQQLNLHKQGFVLSPEVSAEYRFNDRIALEANGNIFGGEIKVKHNLK
mgnify:CR=1 FL=1